MNEKFITANNIELAYDEFGDTNNPVILLIMGLGTQVMAWPEAFCEQLATAGFRVIRFDNRDIGLSQKMSHTPVPNLPKLMIKSRFGLKFQVPYTLDDMAMDAVELLNQLSIDRAHIVGASMGGMIAQLVAANHPNKTASLTSIMSSSGKRGLPAASSVITRKLIAKPPAEIEAAIAFRVKVLQAIGSVGPHKPSVEELTAKARRSYERSVHPPGFARQLAAILHNGSRVHALKRIESPSLIIHGKVDPLVPMECGIDTARHIPNSQLKLIDHMGHDFPDSLIPTLAGLVSTHTRSSQ